MTIAAFIIPICRCGHVDLDHAEGGRRPCECGSGCGRGCACEGFRPALRRWSCAGAGRHAFLGPDDAGQAVPCPICGAAGFAGPMEG